MGGRYLARRVGSLLLTLLFVSAITFFLMRLVPGDPVDVMYGTEHIDASTRELLVARLGLDQPVWIQYGRWIGRVAAGDLGYSYRSKLPVGELIGQRLPPSLLLIFVALGLSVLVALPLGVLTAVRRNSLIDISGLVIAMTADSVPLFVSGILLGMLFGVLLGWLPVMGYPAIDAGVLSYASFVALPSITLATALIGIILRLTRSTVLEELGRDYVRTARAKGLTERSVLVRHVLSNSLLPVLTLLGLLLSYLLGGAVIVEKVFAWPGIGSLVVDAIIGRDYPVVQGVVLLVACLVLAISLIVDLSYAVIDPRIRTARAARG
jgi:peptide/nickel transport system permease protein